MPSARRRLLLATAALAPTVALAQPARLRRDFEDMPLGAPPIGFSFGLTGGGPPPRWAVLEDPSAPAGTRVLAETSGDRTDARFPHAVLNGFSARDVALRVEFRAVAGRVDQAAGLVLRWQDAGNYYVARANALEDNVRLYRVVNGRRIRRQCGRPTKSLAGLGPGRAWRAV
jgi:hypothetical protein